FPTNTGNPANAGRIDRIGVPMVVSPPWNDPTFPKTAHGTVVSIFCIPATMSNTINTTSGLPGPGALILPGTVVVTNPAVTTSTSTTLPTTTTSTTTTTTTTLPTVCPNNASGGPNELDLTVASSGTDLD